MANLVWNQSRRITGGVAAVPVTRFAQNQKRKPDAGAREHRLRRRRTPPVRYLPLRPAPQRAGVPAFEEAREDETEGEFRICIGYRTDRVVSGACIACRWLFPRESPPEEEVKTYGAGDRVG